LFVSLRRGRSDGALEDDPLPGVDAVHHVPADLGPDRVEPGDRDVDVPDREVLAAHVMGGDPLGQVGNPEPVELEPLHEGDDHVCVHSRIARRSMSRSRAQGRPKTLSPRFPGQKVRPIWPFPTGSVSIRMGWVSLVLMNSSLVMGRAHRGSGYRCGSPMVCPLLHPRRRKVVVAQAPAQILSTRTFPERGTMTRKCRA
jgi:hypothetical protein